MATRILGEKAGVGWASLKHTAVAVTTSAVGVGAERFGGYLSMEEVGVRLMELVSGAGKAGATSARGEVRVP